MHWARIDSDGKAHFSIRERLKKISLMNSPMVIIMMIKIMMFQDRICNNMIELTLVVFVSRAACSRPVRVGASLLPLLFPS